jgi:hypothetical protein
MRTAFTTLAALAIVATAATAMTASEADARGRGRGGGETVELSVNTGKEMRHGYSGQLGVGGLYCDYQRIPTHDCSSGRCKVVSWTLKQFCY